MTTESRYGGAFLFFKLLYYNRHDREVYSMAEKLHKATYILHSLGE